VAVLLLFGWRTVLAQEPEPDGPVYLVQPGDTLSIIALQFGITIDDLISFNALENPNQLAVGQRLVIPGLPGVRGVLNTETVPFGETLRSLSRRNEIPIEQLTRLNRLISPGELAVGSSIILPQSEKPVSLNRRVLVGPTETYLEIAIQAGINPWTLLGQNGLVGGHQALPGDLLLVPSEEIAGPGGLPSEILGVSFGESVLTQGNTAVITIETDAAFEFTGALEMTDLRSQAPIPADIHFFSTGPGQYTALQGVHAMAETGLFPFSIQGRMTENGKEFYFSQLVPIQGGGYGFDPPLQVDPKTVEAAVTVPENQMWVALTQPVTGDRFWETGFDSPSPFPDCWTSRFGSRRSYNGSAYNFFHTGLDFCGGVGIEIRAPAAGRVVFAEPLVVRGIATMLDHGWGVYTGYMHQSEIFVEAGDFVEKGQLIGLVGGTGRVTGAHLHWEVWVGGVQVDPVEWLESTYP
jgi:murein DD-endopeptidase MepM/ murein hydrolase activator NlpD